MNWKQDTDARPGGHCQKYQTAKKDLHASHSFSAQIPDLKLAAASFY
jgi:hypothetical protein